MGRKPKPKDPEVGDTVYLRTDPEKQLRLIIKVQWDGFSAKYQLALGDKKTWHKIIELTNEGQKRTEIKGLVIK